VERGSVRRLQAGLERVADDPRELLLDLRTDAGIDPTTAAHLVRELAMTQLADVQIAARPRRTAAELIAADHAVIEGEMDGHPWLVPNKGRLGFGHRDYLAHAPEQARPVTLSWIAVHRSRASWTAVPTLDHDVLLATELDPQMVRAFRSVLRSAGADPASYLWFPVHPWQWDHVVLPLFAADLATGDMIPLGVGPDRYLPQQSIRTLSNLDAPMRHNVKLPLSILNTLVWRGLPTDRTGAAPAVTRFLHGIVAADPFLTECRPVLLGEVAAITVEQREYARLPGAPYQYLELLGCIWRQPVPAMLDPGEQAMTLAALLHVGSDGVPVVQALVQRSGMAPRSWLRSFLHAMLPPLLHMLYRYGTVFSPHGENAMLLHRDGVPTRLGIKDFVDDVNLVDVDLPELADLEPEVAVTLLREPADWICQFLWAALFIGHFRYLSSIVEDSLAVPEREFWALARAEILDHQARFPQLSERFRLFDLLRPRFARICLNRNRLLLDGYADRPERPHAAVHGTVPNALHDVR
jgi:siderophore synthetase component